MKKLVILFLAVSLLAAVAQQKGGAAGKGGQAAKPADQVKTYSGSDLNWGPAPAVLPAGAKLAVLEGNPMQSGPYTMRLQMPAGYKIPPHHHHAREHVTVISGEFLVGMGDKLDESKMSSFSPGAFAYLEPTVHHYAMAKGDTVIQLHGQGPWQIIYVNPADNPQKPAEKK
ncbi:MAG TPA: cupin domain-containing protein [Candidatus Angelobacter sp.]|nr:cupin domain-containing protein [Candidatus Angelobacter sp.]